MKKLSLFFAFLLLLFHAQAQEFQEISTGATYNKQSFINLSNATQKQVDNSSWDIAFTVFGLQDAGVFVNESAGTNAGVAQSAVELYDAQTNNFSDQPDPLIFKTKRLFNSEKSWDYGAFNEVRDTLDPFDFGWGKYNFQSNQVNGSKIYVVKLRNGQYRKFKIESLIVKTYTFRYANLDGSSEVTKTVDKAQHPGKTLAYFSFESGAMVDVEPAPAYDFIFCRYNTPLQDTGTVNFVDYNVTGILHARGAKVAEADGVNPLTVSFSNYQDSLRTRLDAIGFDWKYFSNNGWTIDEDRTFFLKTAENHVWKIHFIDFEGVSTGTAVFEKTDLGITSAVQSPDAAGLEVSLYPNPVQEQLTVALDIPGALAQEAQIDVVDMQGRSILQHSVSLKLGFQIFELPAATWSPGMYVVRLRMANQEIKLGKALKI